MAGTVDRLAMRARGFRGDDRGGAAIIYALTLPIVMGFVGLGVEVGDWYMTRQALQNSADAGAWAASVAYYYDPNISHDDLTAAARAGVERSGVSDAAVAVQAAQALPGGLGNLGIRVSLTKTKPTLFAASFGMASTDIAASALASAALDSINSCLTGLDRTAQHSISTNGSAWSVPAGCDIHSNSGVYMNGNPDLSDIEVSYSGDSCDAPAEVCGKPAIQPYNDPYANVDIDANGLSCTFTNLAAAEAGRRYAQTSPRVVGLRAGSGRATNPALVPVAKDGGGGASSIDGQTIDLADYPDRTVVLCGDSTFSADTTFVGPGRVIVNGSGGSFDANGMFIGDQIALIFVDIDLGHIGGNGGLRIKPMEKSSVAALSAGLQGVLEPWVGIALYADRETVSGTWEITGSFDVQVDGVIYMPEVDLVVKGNIDPYNASGCVRVFTATADIRGNIDFGQASCNQYGAKGVGRVRPRIYG